VTDTRTPEETTVTDLTPRLTDVSPAVGPFAVDTSGGYITWLGCDGGTWEAHRSANVFDHWDVFDASDVGADEEDYVSVFMDDLLDVIANGLGAHRRKR
jgi:hypothetical protein